MFKESGHSERYLDCFEDSFFFIRESPTTIPTLFADAASYPCPVHIKFPTHKQVSIGTGLSFVDIDYSLVNTEVEWKILKIPVAENSCETFECIFIFNRKLARCPALVYVHGGPHDCTTAAYDKNWLLFSYFNLNVLLINYRGSIGFGEGPLESILGKSGSQDVLDCMKAVDFIAKFVKRLSFSHFFQITHPGL